MNPRIDRRRFMAFFGGLGLAGTLLPDALWAELESAGEVTKTALLGAEKLAGLEFSDEERNLMLEGLGELKGDYERLRQVPLSNSMPPALHFDPEPEPEEDESEEDRARALESYEMDRDVLEVLRSLGIELIPIELPELPVTALSFILSAEAAAAFDGLTRSGRDDLLVRQIENAWPNVFRQGRLADEHHVQRETLC